MRPRRCRRSSGGSPGRVRGAARLSCATGLADEPDSGQRHDPEDDPHPRAVGEDLRQDVPRVLHRGLDAVVLGEVVDEIAARGAAHGQHQEPDDEHADRERAQLDPATPAGQPDCERCDSERDEPHPVGDRAQDPRDRLRRLQLALVDDRDLPGDSGSLSATFPITATCSPRSIMIGRRSSTTSPPSVWTNFVLSSSSLTS